MDPRKKLQLKTLLKKLDGFRARHTELITVYIPSGYSIVSVTQQLMQEQGTAENIKSKTTRKNVQAALERMVRQLRTYKATPHNGLALFSGNVSESEGGQDFQIFAIEPPESINIKIYKCDQTFYLEPLKEIMSPKKTYGLLVIDRQEANIALLRGTTIIPLIDKDSLVPGKTRKGGQCLHPESLVMLNDGDILPIKDTSCEYKPICGDFINYTSTETAITDKWENNKTNMYEIITKNPRTKIIASGDHGFFVFDDEILETPANDLKEGNYLIMPEQIKISGKPQKLATDFYTHISILEQGQRILKKARENAKLLQRELGESMGVTQSEISLIELGKRNVSKTIVATLCELLDLPPNFIEKYCKPSKSALPSELTPDCAQLIGYFLGDGSYDTNKICLHEQRENVAQSYVNIAKSLCDATISVKFRTDKNYYLIRIYSLALVNQMRAEFPELRKATSSEIPKKILKSPDNVLARFLKGFFDAEGYSTYRCIGLGINNELLANQIQMVLLRFGILCSVHEYDNNCNPYSNNTRYTVDITDTDSMRVFAEKIGFTDSEKQNKIHNVLRKRTTRSVTRQMLAKGKYVRKIIERHNYNVGCFPKVSNFFNNSRMMSKSVFESSILSEIKDRALHSELLTLTNRKLIPVKIQSIRKLYGTFNTIDISTNHANFMANGLIVHNSAHRFERVREGMAKDFFKKIASEATDAFRGVVDLHGIIIGGPGPTKENFVSGFLPHDIKEKVIAIKDVGYTGAQGLQELVFKSQDVLAKEDIIEEQLAVNRFLETLNKRPKFATYGEMEVKRAVELGAVELLLISEDVDEELAEKLSERVENSSGAWRLISRNSREGEQLTALGGLGAVLRFPIE